MDKKLEKLSTFGSVESVSGKVSAYAKKSTRLVGGGNNVCFQAVCHHINKKMDVSTEQFYAVKYCMRLKKSKMETIALSKEAFQNEMWHDSTICQNFETDARVIQETQRIFGHILKNEFEITVKKRLKEWKHV